LAALPFSVELDGDLSAALDRQSSPTDGQQCAGG
jgi:hypothetical protein